MLDDRRDQIYTFVEKELIGPDPLDKDGFVQENGEEILISDSPLSRYIAGILFPRDVIEESMSVSETEEQETADYEEGVDRGTSTEGSYNDQSELPEELINRSNAYRQSAMSISVALDPNDEIRVDVSAGHYKTISPLGDMSKSAYYREPVAWDNNGEMVILPSPKNRMVQYEIPGTDLCFDITFRYQIDDYSIYTFTLENCKEPSGTHKDEDCYFQAKFKLESSLGFHAFPENKKVYVSDEDYLSNQLLYRSIKNYAIGHGIGVVWETEEEIVRIIKTSVFPSYEIKPIVPNTFEDISLKMLDLGPESDFVKGLRNLETMCGEYKIWIEKLEKRASLLDSNYMETAERHIDSCKLCHDRMVKGISILKENESARIAFQYMNLAMLMQQIHYNLPLQKWDFDETGETITLDSPYSPLPVPYNSETWYGDKNRYGKWRPFQIAFILMNIQSMLDKDSSERSIIDLIWFPTGGGKTEAYLGLSAFTIFLRRLKNAEDDGTAILMRYTLRLLTAQQYERASALICACDLIRKEHEDMFGTARFSIGLWVGIATTPNKIKEAVDAYDDLKQHGGKNPFVMLKCPWCGAQMGVCTSRKGITKLPGYALRKNRHGKKTVVFKCNNVRNGCAFSSKEYPLPLYIDDESIYQNKPTLLIGTVDKFAMLPFKPEAKSLFGYDNGQKKTSPDLIIQDELHLISGPLGSMVGHYETMIHELCSEEKEGKKIYPKIIASTATISRAKQQCHALYGCSTEQVFQFPPSGIDAGDSFFAKEDNDANGRRYVGIFASGSSSDATTAIRVYAALLYAGKALRVHDEEDRDPYWTNVGYFNSIRELGQAATWIKSDIDQYLDVIYKRKLFNKDYSREEYRERRRYIYRDEELTSRIEGDKVTESLANLNIGYPPHKDSEGKVKEYPIDICLATNMISVGLDVSRLGLMTVVGQPKTTSEYIQATSRVGSNGQKAPGIVFVLYRPGRPRDRSYYERFVDYHSKIYSFVEPTSVTPFSSPVRERALHAVMIGLMRLMETDSYNSDPPRFTSPEKIAYIKDVIEARVKEVDEEELDETMTRFDAVLEEWAGRQPECWTPKYDKNQAFLEDLPLIFSSGSIEHENWKDRSFRTPTSMRNVDASCEAEIMRTQYRKKDN